jgi:hypothetical protein
MSSFNPGEEIIIGEWVELREAEPGFPKGAKGKITYVNPGNLDNPIVEHGFLEIEFPEQDGLPGGRTEHWICIGWSEFFRKYVPSSPENP